MREFPTNADNAKRPSRMVRAHHDGQSGIAELPQDLDDSRQHSLHTMQKIQSGIGGSDRPAPKRDCGGTSA
jgi:hypothetical protein